MYNVGTLNYYYYFEKIIKKKLLYQGTRLSLFHLHIFYVNEKNLQISQPIYYYIYHRVV